MFDNGDGSPAIIEGAGFAQIKPGDRLIAPLDPKSRIELVGKRFFVQKLVLLGPGNGYLVFTYSRADVSPQPCFFGEYQVNFV